MINIDAIVWKYGFKEGLTIRGNEITEWPYSDDKPSNATIKNITSEYESEKHKNELRFKALSDKWDNPFDLIDDILKNGIDSVEKERVKIKTEFPKGRI